MHGKSAEESWTQFCSTVNASVERFVPLKLRRKKFKPVWMDLQTLRMIRKKNRYWKSLKFNNHPGRLMKYKELEKEARKATRNSKRRFERNLAKEKNKRAFTSYVRSKTKNRVAVGPLKEDGKVVSSNADMAGILNNFFSSIFTVEDTTSLPEIDKMEAKSILNHVQFTPRKLKKRLTS